MKLSKQCQRVLSLLLAILFLATSMPSSVYASEISVSPEAAYTENVDEADKQEAAYTENVDEADKQEAQVTEEQPDAQIQEEQPEDREQEDMSAEASDVTEQDDAEVKTEESKTVADTESAQDTNSAVVLDTDASDEGTTEVETTPVVEDLKIAAGNYNTSNPNPAYYLDALNGAFDRTKTEYDNVTLTDIGSGYKIWLHLSDGVSSAREAYIMLFPITESWEPAVQIPVS